MAISARGIEQALAPSIPTLARAPEPFRVLDLDGQLLGYEPRVDFKEGLNELVEWLEGQVAVDRVDQASAELSARGLTV